MALTVLITGASRGLGLEFVRQYAADRWSVIACCRAPEKAAALREIAKNSQNVKIEMLDVDHDKDIRVLAAKLKGTAIDLLINCAGIYSGDARRDPEKEDPTQTFGSLDSAGWAKVLRTNAIAPVMVAEAFRDNIAATEKGKIVMISSIMGSIDHVCRSGDIAYRSSKAALNAAMKSVAMDLKDKGIVVISLHPGWVRTDMGGKTADISVEESVSNMRKTINGLKMDKSGTFLTHDGKALAW